MSPSKLLHSLTEKPKGETPPEFQDPKGLLKKWVDHLQEEAAAEAEAVLAASEGFLTDQEILEARSRYIRSQIQNFLTEVDQGTNALRNTEPGIALWVYREAFLDLKKKISNEGWHFLEMEMQCVSGPNAIPEIYFARLDRGSFEVNGNGVEVSTQYSWDGRHLIQSGHLALPPSQVAMVYAFNDEIPKIWRQWREEADMLRRRPFKVRGRKRRS